MMNPQQPIIVLKEGTKEEKGRDAQRNNIAAGIAIAEVVKSTLGPKGMDKMLVDSMGDVVVTNDGATILKEIDVEHPAAKMVVEVAKSQDEECGDGTTSAVVLTGELLKNAQKLIDQNIHPTIIAQGYRKAMRRAKEILEELSIDIKSNDKETLKSLVLTSLASKNASAEGENLSKIVVASVSKIIENIDNKMSIDLDNIQIQKVTTGAISDTTLISGIVLDKELENEEIPKKIKNANILLLNFPLEVRKTEVEANIQITDPSQLQKFLDEEERIIKEMVEKIKLSGANVVLNQKGIDDIATYYLSKYGIMSVRRVKKSDMKKLSKATGGKILANLEDISKDSLGYAGIVEEEKFGDAKVISIKECKNPKSMSILLRGPTDHIVDEIERALHDALSVVKIALEDKKIIVGGGATAAEIAMRLKDEAPIIGGRIGMAMEEFANALEVIPKTLAENAGYDPIDIMLEIRHQHKKGNKYHGLDIETGKVENLYNNAIIEPIRVGIHEIEASTEAAIMILRIDDVIASKKVEMNEKEKNDRYGNFNQY